MRRIKYLWLAALLSLAVIVSPSSAQDKSSCSCSTTPGGPLGQLENYDPIFVGIIDSIVDDTTDDHWLNVDATVLRSFGKTKLYPLEKTRVEVLNGCGFGCGYCWFEEGKPFIVYAERVEWRDKPFVTFCSRTAPLEDAFEDLVAFDALDLVEPDDGSRCGGPNNVAALQSALIVILVLGMAGVARS